MLEDPEFTIKEAVITTPYPGPSAAEVEKEVTNVIEKALQEMGQLEYVWSRSSRGLSIVHPVINDKYDKKTLPLLEDAFFVGMAVTIMFGLGFATLLTLIVVPVLYAVFFRIKHE